MPIRHPELGRGKRLSTRKEISNAALHSFHRNGSYPPAIVSTSEFLLFIHYAGFLKLLIERLYSAQDDHWVARLGALRRGSNLLSPHEQVRVISHIFIHPGYIDTGFVNDISILRMEEPVRFTDYIRPVCLPPPTADIRDGRLCTVVGWGQLYETGRVFRKRKILLKLCRLYRNNVFIVFNCFANSRHPTASSITSSLDRRVSKANPLPSSLPSNQQHVLRRFRSRRTRRLSRRFRRSAHVRGKCNSSSFN